MSLVIDSSVALTWCFEDERTPGTLALLEQIVESGAVAPALWPLEVLNGLRKRLKATQRRRLTGFLHGLPITLDHETATQAWGATVDLAERFQLTVYDAAYLELAQRLTLPLATLDRALLTAATKLGVTVLAL